MLGPMSVDRRRPVAAVLALLGALLVVAAVIGTAVHYAAQPDAADTYDSSVDTSAAAAFLAGQPDRLEAPTRSISVG